MDDQLLMSDNTDDDQAQGDGSSSPVSSDDDDENTHPLTSSLTSFLSTEDIDKCLYVTNINWRRRFSIRLSNGQLDDFSSERRERLHSASSTDHVNLNRASPLYLPRYRNSWWFRSRTASSSSLDEYNSSTFNDQFVSYNSTPTAYARLKRFTERLLDLERKARESVFDNQCNQNSASKTEPTTAKVNRSLKKNDEPVGPATAAAQLPNSNPTAKLRRIRSDPQLTTTLSSPGSLRKIQTMSAMKLLPVEPSSTVTYLVATETVPPEKANLPVKEKKISFEVNTSKYSRKVEVKTKQEEQICTTKNPTSPTVITRVTQTASSPSLSRLNVQQQPRSTVVNSSIQRVRVSVSSSPQGNDLGKSAQTQFTFTTPANVTPNDDSYSVMISNFVSENLAEPSKSDVEETFDRRPLLNLISELNRRHTVNQPIVVPPLHRDRSLDRIPTSPLTADILPPKPLSPFRPVIVHKKYQEPIGRFEFVDGTSESSPQLTRQNSRTSVTRSRTFNVSTKNSANVVKIPANEIKTTDDATCQSTPELSCSTEREQERNEPTIHMEESHGLSTSGTMLSSTSLTGLAPTSSGTIDDKNEAKRKAIAMQMYDTEKSYVEALKNLVTKYYLPMKDKAVISNDLVNDIFYKIPEIHIHHTAFLISLSQKLSQWDNKQTVGDLLLQMFTRTSVIETYTSFVNNYKTAQIAIRLCRDSSSFNKFLEQQARVHRGRLTLRDLIIQPVQRIPRYELYIKDFLKCTNLNHPDYQLLLKAQSEIHSLAEQIDQVQKDVGSTELAVTNNSLEVVQEMIENLTDLAHADRYYIRHDVVTLQSPSGLKKDRCIFLFNDLVIITSCKRRSGTLTKKPTTSVIVNSPSGKQYIDNAKHKLIMKISLESMDLTADVKKRGTPPILVKSHSNASASGDKYRHLEDDVVTLSHISDLAKTITVPHQQLEESLKETLHAINKHITDETASVTSARTTSPEPSIAESTQQKSNNVQLIIHTTERTETIDVLFSSAEHKATWQKSFLEAKKALFEVATGRRNISFQHVLTLPHSRPGSQFSCGAPRLSLGDICICNSEGQVCLVNVQPNVTLKACNTVISSRINCVAYVPSHKGRRAGSSIKHRHHHHHQHKQKHRGEDDEGEEHKHEGHHLKQGASSILQSADVPTTVESFFDIDSSDDEDASTVNTDDLFTLDPSAPTQQCILLESELNNEPQDTREATMWLGTDDGIILIFQCTETMKTVARKSRIVKQLGSPIHSILYTDNKVFVALSHGELCVFRRDLGGRWDLDCPIIRSIEEESLRRGGGPNEIDDGDNADPISVMALAAGRLWCAIRDRIFVVCPNSLTVEHSFLVDDCHRHVCSIAPGGSSMHHVWIASQGSHEIRLYHATHFVCLLETSIRTAVTQKLQVCDDIIRAHKLGCLRVSALHICKETLWVGTSAGVLINISVPQLLDSSNNKLTASSLQLKSLSFGHAGPVRFIISTDTTVASSTDESPTVKTVVLSIGDGFEDYATNDETLGKDDALPHVIVWQL